MYFIGISSLQVVWSVNPLSMMSKGTSGEGNDSEIRTKTYPGHLNNGHARTTGKVKPGTKGDVDDQLRI